MQFKPTRFAVLLAGFVASYGVLAQDATTYTGSVTAQGTDSTSTGLIVQEETPKARSSVNREYLDKQSPVSNPYQAIQQLPGVSTFSYDGTGLYGGALRIRGFNSDQLGFTINGAPVNDSGNFAVYPQEYTDIENLCEVFVTQGSTDVNAPHVGASGGNVGLVSCAPHDERGIRVKQTVGDLNMYKTFVRLDTGLIGQSKTYISYSKAEANKFKGEGRADKQHVDFGSEYDLTSASKISISLLYNRADNNNFRTLSLAQYRANPVLDYGIVPPQHLTPVAGKAQVEAAPADGYYGLSINPFENAVATANGSFKLADSLRLDINPYFWYGFGTGGTELFAQKEGLAGSPINGGVADLNGDGDTLDTVLIYSGSVTRTFRPGVTSTVTWSLPNNTIVAGGWVERAHHRQTGPGELLTGSGLNATNFADSYLDNPGAWIKYNDGEVYEFRNWNTVSTGYSGFLSDTISLLRDKLTLVPAFRYSGINRDFTNYANTSASGAFNGYATYNVQKTYDDFLPSFGVRYALTDTQSLYANATKNFRVPSNFVYSNLLRSNVTTVAANGTVTYVNQFVNGKYVNYSQRAVPVDKETSWNYETGYRYATERVTASTALFYNSFKNRIASAYNPETATTTDYNVGDSDQYGLEGEIGVNIYGPITGYMSASYLRSKIDNNLNTGNNTFAPTAGKQFPDTPNVLSALTLEYKDKFGYFGMLQGKYTGRRESTLVNDQNIPGYVGINLAAGYTYPGAIAFIKQPFIRFNAINATNEHFLNLTGPSGSNFTTNALPYVSNGTTVAASSPSYYVGAPDFFSVTFGSDF